MRRPVPTAEDQIVNFFNLLFTTQGALVIAAALALFILLAVFRWLKWPVLGALLWASIQGVGTREYFANVLIFPLEHIRIQGRGLTAGLLVALLIPTVMSGRGARQRLILGGTIVFLIFEMLLSARIATGGLLSRGVIGGLIFLLIFSVLGVGISKWLQSVRDVHAALWAIVGAGMVFVGLTVVQLAVDPGNAHFHGRLFAIAPNPQAAGLFLGISLPVAVYFLLRREVSGFFRIVLIGHIGLSAIFLAWTGSRTSALTALTALALLFRMRFGKLLVVGMMIGAVVLGAMQIYEESSTGFARLTSSENTREAQWEALISDFRASPIIGVISSEVNVAESAYLSTLARMGLIGFAVLLLFMFLIGRALIRLQHVRRDLGEDRLLADLVTGQLVAMAVASFFEGLLLGTLAYWIFCLYIQLAILAFLLDPAWVQGRPAAEAYSELRSA